MASSSTKRVADVREQVQQLANTNELLRERLSELELALEDRDWLRMTLDADREFSRMGLDRISRIARLMYLKNPLIQRGVNVKRFYVWGQGVSIKANDDDINTVLQAFLDDPKNQAELTSHQARMMKEVDLEVDGNLFFVFFVNHSTGRVRIRTIPFSEITEIITDPDDAKSPWFYLRRWTQVVLNNTTGVQETETKVAYYPDWHCNLATKPTTIAGTPVMWDTPVYHVRVGGFSDWRFGVSEIYAAIDWAKAYKSFLENWASIVQAYARFAFKLTTPGGKGGIAAAKAKLGTTYGGSSGETNPAPVAGSTFIAGDHVDLQPVRTSGATTSAEDGRRMLLMVAAVVGLPETFFGDTSVGTLATAKSLDRPTELMMRDRQTLWADVHRAIVRYVILQAVKAPNGALRGLGRVEEDDEGEERVTWNDGVDTHIDIDFPPLIADDVAQRMTAIAGGAGLVGDLLPDELLVQIVLSALGVDDIDEIMKRVREELEKRANEPQPEQTVPTAEALMLDAVRELRETLHSIMTEAAK